MCDNSNQIIAIDAIIPINLEDQDLLVLGARVDRINIFADPYSITLSLRELLNEIFTCLVEGSHIDISGTL